MIEIRKEKIQMEDLLFLVPKESAVKCQHHEVQISAKVRTEVGLRIKRQLDTKSRIEWK